MSRDGRENGGKDAAQFTAAYHDFLGALERVREVYDLYELQQTPEPEAGEAAGADVEAARAESLHLEYFLHEREEVTSGVLNGLIRHYFDMDDDRYRPVLEGDAMRALTGLSRHEDAATRFHSYLMVNLFMRAAYCAAQPGDLPQNRRGTAECLRLACYFNEVRRGTPPAAAIGLFYPGKRARLGDYPLAPASAASAFRAALDRVTETIPHVRRHLFVPEGYKVYTPERAPHLRVLLRERGATGPKPPAP
jgi:hypothetical protein